jgi:hypothetical protein
VLTLAALAPNHSASDKKLINSNGKHEEPRVRYSGAAHGLLQHTSHSRVSRKSSTNQGFTHHLNVLTPLGVSEAALKRQNFKPTSCACNQKKIGSSSLRWVFSPLKTQTQGFKRHLKGLHCFALRIYEEQIQPAFCGAQFVVSLLSKFKCLRYIKLGVRCLGRNIRSIDFGLVWD